MEAVVPAPVAPNPAVVRALESIISAPLRADIIMRRQVFRHEEYYVVKDPLALTYFRLQPEEAYMLTLLDGKRTLREIVERFNRRYPNNPRSVAELSQFISQLGAGGLLNVSANRFVANAQKTGSQQLLMMWAKAISGLLFIKVPLLDPSPWLGKLVHAIRFVWTKPFVYLVLAFYVWTAGFLLANAGEFAAHRVDFFSSTNLMLLWLSIIVIKTLHEFGHATTCRRFGGEVHEMGFCLMCFTPCGYVDASDAWMMRQKRHKLYTTIAGVFTELILACIAAHFWLILPDGLARSLAFNAMVVASVNTLIFNANPLMRFDGYYVLCDLLEIPNLRTKAIAFCSYHLQRIFLGFRNRQQESSFEQEVHGRAFLFYSVAAYAYMISIIYGLTQVFGRVLDPYGLREFGLAVGYFVEGSFVVLPFIKVSMDALMPGAHITKTGSTSRRLSFVMMGLAGIVAASLIIPTHHHITQQAIVIPNGFEAIESDVGGVVRQVHVRTGDWVKPGDLIVTLENTHIESELRVAEANRQQARVRFGAAASVRGGRQAGNNAKMAQEIEGAEAGYELAATRARSLELRAKTGGYVLTPDVGKLVGSYAPPSVQLVKLGDMKHIQLAIALSENEARLVGRGAAFEGRWLANGRYFQGQLAGVTSHPAKASEFHPGMLAYYGGGVPTQASGQRGNTPDYPIFVATAELENPGEVLVEGMRARVRIEGEATTWGRKAWRWFLSLFSLHHR